MTKAETKKAYVSLLEPLIKAFIYDWDDKTHIKAYFLKMMEFNPEGELVQASRESLQYLKWGIC